MKNGKLIPFFTYEREETAEKKDADKIMLSIIKNTLLKDREGTQ